MTVIVHVLYDVVFLFLLSPITTCISDSVFELHSVVHYYANELYYRLRVDYTLHSMDYTLHCRAWIANYRVVYNSYANELYYRVWHYTAWIAYYRANTSARARALDNDLGSKFTHVELGAVGGNHVYHSKTHWSFFIGRYNSFK